MATFHNRRGSRGWLMVVTIAISLLAALAAVFYFGALPVRSRHMPSVSIWQPSDGDTVSASVSVGAAYSIESGSIHTVQLLVDGVVVDSAAVHEQSGSHVFVWTSATVADGQHAIAVRAHAAAPQAGHYSEDSIALIVANAACHAAADCDDGDDYTADLCQNPGQPDAVCAYSSIACLSAGDCDDADAQTVDTCGNPGTASAACAHTAIACATVADCDDGNALTLDACANGGTVTAACTHNEIVCLNDADCDDSDALTIDLCGDPGTAAALCIHNAVACASAADCDDADALTVDTCGNPGTASAACAHTAVACASAADCDDGDAYTLDTCANGGTVAAACIHNAVTCLSDTDCDDSDVLTIDLCGDPGTAAALCAHNPVACASDADCGDADALTVDTCGNPGTVSAACAHTAIACATAGDCDDGNAYTLDACANGGTVTSACAHNAVACLNDADCDDGGADTVDHCTNPGTAGAACAHAPVPEPVAPEPVNPGAQEPGSEPSDPVASDPEPEPAALSLDVTYPEDNALLNTKTIVLQGQVTPGASVTVGRETFVCQSGVITREITLDEGVNALAVSARLGAQNLTRTIPVQVDTQAPAFISMTPAQGGAVSAAPEKIKLRIEDAPRGSGIDASAIRVYLNGDEAPGAYVQSSKSYEFAATLEPGVQVITVEAADNAGNFMAPAAVSFTYAPREVEQPSPAAAAPAAPAPADAPPPVLPPRYADIAATAPAPAAEDLTDAELNMVSLLGTVLPKYIPPKAHIRKPDPGAVAQGVFTVDVSFISSDVRVTRVTLRINGADYQTRDLAPGTRLGDAAFEIDTATLHDGEKILTAVVETAVYANRPAETGVSHPVSVVVDNTPPEVTIVAINSSEDEHGGYTADITALVSDPGAGMDQSRASAVLDNEIPASAAFEPDTGLLKFTASGLAPGEHVADICAPDRAGHACRRIRARFCVGRPGGQHAVCHHSLIIQLEEIILALQELDLNEFRGASPHARENSRRKLIAELRDSIRLLQNNGLMNNPVMRELVLKKVILNVKKDMKHSDGWFGGNRHNDFLAGQAGQEIVYPLLEQALDFTRLRGLCALDLAPESVELNIGETRQFTVTGSFGNQAVRDLTGQAYYALSNDSVGAVSDTGLFTAAAAGTSTLTADLFLVQSNAADIVVTGGKPAIVGLSPDTGPVDTLVTITGENFDPDPAGNVVLFNGAPAEVVAASRTQLQVIAPPPGPHSQLVIAATGGTVTASPGATTGPVTVQVGDEISGENPVYTVNPPPFLASVQIPPGVLSEDTVITVKPLTEKDLPVPPPPGMMFNGGVDFEPDGLEFNGYVVIQMPLVQPQPPYSRIPLYLFDDSVVPQPTEFVDTGTKGIVMSDGTWAVALVNHFSIYQWFFVNPGDPIISPFGGVVPNSGNVTQTITLNGSNFFRFVNPATTYVKFGADQAGGCGGGIDAPASVLDDGLIQVQVPVDANAYATSMPPATVELFVYDPTIPFGPPPLCGFLMTNDDQTYTVNAPECKLISPRRGQPGDTIAIAGMNFSEIAGNNTVYFNGGVLAAAPSINYYNALELTVPAGAVTGNVLIASNSQTSAPVAPACKFHLEPGKKAYVPDPGADNAAVMDLETNSLLTTVATAADPVSAAYTADTTRVVVVNKGAGNVSIIDADGDSKLSDVTPSFNADLHDVAMAPSFTNAGGAGEGDYAYVTVRGDDRISVIDVAAQSEIANIDVSADCDAPTGIGIVPSGRLAYVSCRNSNHVIVLRTDTHAVVDPIWVGVDPGELKITPSGKLILVVNEFDDSVSIIDPGTNTVIQTISVGDSPQRIAILPDSSKAYVSNRGDGTVSVINLTTYAVSTIAVGTLPDGLDVTPDGKQVYVANSGSSSLTVINTLTDTVSATVSAIGTNPTDIAIEPFEPFARPAITSITPNNANRGANITITGTDFDPAPWRNSVMFSRYNPPSAVSGTVVSANATQLVVTVPDYAKTGVVTVTVDNRVSNAMAFTVNNMRPSIKNISPAGGIPGDVVTITGADFNAAAAQNTVDFGGFAATPSAGGGMTLTVTVPAGVPCGPTTVDVTDNGTSLTSNTVPFTGGYTLSGPEFIPDPGDSVFYPTWSHDGTRLAFVSRVQNAGVYGPCGGTSCDDWNVYVMTYSGGAWGDKKIITNDDMDVWAGHGLAWTPDDAFVVFSGCSMYGADSGNAANNPAHCETNPLYYPTVELFAIRANGADKSLTQLDIKGLDQQITGDNDVGNPERWWMADWSGDNCAVGSNNDDILIAMRGTPAKAVMAAFYGTPDTNGLYHQDTSTVNILIDFPATQGALIPKWRSDCNEIMFAYMDTIYADMITTYQGLYKFDVSGGVIGMPAITDIAATTEIYECTYNTGGGTIVCPDGTSWFSSWRNTNTDAIASLDGSNTMTLREWTNADPVGNFFAKGDYSLWGFDTTSSPAPRVEIKDEPFHEFMMYNCTDHNNPPAANCPVSANDFAYSSMGPKTDGSLRFLYNWNPSCPIVE